NGSLVPDSIVPFLVGCTFSFQLFLTGLVFYNLFKAPKIDLNNSELFIKKFFLISASVSELMILITLLMYRQEDSEIRYWFVTLFNFAFLLTSFMLLKIHKTKNKEKIKHPLLSSNEIELIKISFANFLINNKQLLYEDCTLKNISEKINIPEYKLRKFINVELKFNNFQHFINFYRIEEACRLLKSQEYEKIPISRIALMVGYNSIATFNRVFKEVKNASPGEYRLN
ncbi:MAG TPA: AraC family transcriptional regulator, partial [Leptospiraceae bacterium]|nr:AraC family transcriptional regulator [Leptospiraceae bacterium]